jgi:hypothetical protein
MESADLRSKLPEVRQFQPHQELLPECVLHHFFKRSGIYLTRIEETTRLPRSRETP